MNLPAILHLFFVKDCPILCYILEYGVVSEIMLLQDVQGYVLQ